MGVGVRARGGAVHETDARWKTNSVFEWTFRDELEKVPCQKETFNEKFEKG